MEADLFSLAAYDYVLDPARIAQSPMLPRDHSRLLTLNRETGAIEHKRFYDLSDLLGPNDMLVFNNTKVIPARLKVKCANGAQGELLLIRQDFPNSRHPSACWDPEPFEAKSKLSTTSAGDSSMRWNDGSVWETMVKPGKRFQINQQFSLLDRSGAIVAEGRVLEILSNENRLVEISASREAVLACGYVPLPPYIKNNPQTEAQRRDSYQSVLAQVEGAVAAPTASLHFTTELLEKIKAKGIAIETVTLHVGPGTFLPVKVADIRQHPMHSERYSVDAQTWQRILTHKQNGGRVVAVGTTVVRTLEAIADCGLQSAESNLGLCAGVASINPQSPICNPQLLDGETSIFIQPGHVFQIVDTLITNFHTPKSTLLVLVSAFAGRDKIMAAYQAAIQNDYRFFSFGDGMLIA